MIIKIYRKVSWLSLDIIVGANLFLAFLGKHYQIDISLNVFIALSMAIWLIYTVDHLVDAMLGKRLTPRRKFHRKHSRLLVMLSGIALMVGLVNITFLPIEIIKTGSVLGSICILYLMTVYFFRKLWFKEVLVAMGYSVGLFLAPIVLIGKVQWIDMILILQLCGLALANLLIFSHFEREEDQAEGFGSLALKIQSDIQIIITTLLLLIALSNIIMALYLPFSFLNIQIIYLLMAAVLLFITSFPSFFIVRERFRVVGDAIFFLPVFFLF